MTKKRKHPVEGQFQNAEVWRPKRAMGLARALNKAGWGTRRQTVELVESGVFSVVGRAVKDPLHPVAPDSEILMEGQELFVARKSYFAFHKPMRVICGPSDGMGRKMIDEYFPTWIRGLQAAGRLDGRTTGLMLVSNDPAWNNRVAGELRPEQEYRVQVEGELSELEVDVLSAGIHLPGLGVFRPLAVKVIETLNGRTVMHIVVRDGKVRQIRRMFSTLRHKITLLRRIRIAEVWLGDLPVGGVRPMTAREVEFIRTCPAGPSEPAERRPPKP